MFSQKPPTYVTTVSAMSFDNVNDFNRYLFHMEPNETLDTWHPVHYLGGNTAIIAVFKIVRMEN
jgi:hypothetical protein